MDLTGVKCFKNGSLCFSSMARLYTYYTVIFHIGSFVLYLSIEDAHLPNLKLIPIGSKGSFIMSK